MEKLIKTFRTITEKLAEHLPEDKKYIMDEVFQHFCKALEPQVPAVMETWRGVDLPPGFDAQTIEYAYESLDYKEDSVFVVTYPKTGTTWTIQIIRQMLYGHDEKMKEISKMLIPQMNYLEMGTALKHDAMLNLPLPRVLYGSHLTEDLVNVERITKRNGKFVIVLRNPKDQAVSLYHFLQHPSMGTMRDRIPSDWPGFFEVYPWGAIFGIRILHFRTSIVPILLYAGKLPLLSRGGEWYPDHILGWYKHKDHKNFLFLYYEDMKQDCGREIRKIADFLNLDLSDDRLKKIEESTSFAAMKKQSEDGRSDAVAKFVENFKFVRKGQVGSWKEVFTVAQSELMDKLIAEKLKHTDITFTYEL